MPIYTYPELKGRIKVGDTVIHKGKKKKVTEVCMDYFGLDDDLHYSYNYPEYSLELLEEKTLDTVDVGDVLVGEQGAEFTISDTAKNGFVLFLTSDRTPQYTFALTRKYLKESGHTVKQAPQPVIMTREEAEQELSKDGKQVKIV